MKHALLRATFVIGLTACGAATAQAQTTVTLPDTSQTTVLTANVSEQARVTVPASVTFNVTNVGAATPASAAASVTISQIVLATATKQLRVSIQAAAASFTPPASGGTTWDAGDVSWNAATWTSATGTAGTLSNASYQTVATCGDGASSCSTTGMLFSLAAKSSVQHAGNHTLTVTWKFEAIGT